MLERAEQAVLWRKCAQNRASALSGAGAAGTRAGQAFMPRRLILFCSVCLGRARQRAAADTLPPFSGAADHVGLDPI